MDFLVIIEVVFTANRADDTFGSHLQGFLQAGNDFICRQTRDAARASAWGSLSRALQQALAFLEPALRRTLPGATDDKAGRKDGNAGQSKKILNSSGCFQRGRAPVGLYPKYWQPGTLRKSAKPLTQDFAQTGRICAPLCNRASCADRKIQSFEFHVNQHTTY